MTKKRKHQYDVKMTSTLNPTFADNKSDEKDISYSTKKIEEYAERNKANNSLNPGI